MNHEELARQTLDVCLGVHAGQRIWIHTWDHCLDLASDLAWESRKRGCHLLFTVEPEDLWLRSITSAPLNILDALPPQQIAAVAETDVYLFTLGPRKPVPWEHIPKERHRAVSIWLDTRYDRSTFATHWAAAARQRRVRMLGIEATLATPERAEVLGLDYSEWKQVMFAGCMADYAQIATRGNALAARLSGADQVHITSPDGTNLTFSLDGRPVGVSDGLASERKAELAQVTFLPAGGVEVSADESSAEGTLVYDVPIRTGRGTVERLTLHIQHGRIAQFTAGARADIFSEYLRGRGDVNRFAFFGFGLNAALRHGFTQDDKVLGGVTVGFGDNENKGGRNHAQGDEWWGSITRATVRIGQRMIMDQGALHV